MCPRCGTVFNATHARVYPGILRDLFRTPMLRSIDRVIAESATVRCPQCGHRFASVAVRFFGVLSPLGLKTFIGVMLVIIFSGIGYLIFFR